MSAIGDEGTLRITRGTGFGFERRLLPRFVVERALFRCSRNEVALPERVELFDLELVELVVLLASSLPYPEDLTCVYAKRLRLLVLLLRLTP
jgi:hypothetical protein